MNQGDEKMPSVTMKAKTMWTSKTFWLNVITGLVATIAVLNEVQVELLAFADILEIPAWVTRWLLLVNTIANIVLRRISDLPARFSAKPETVVVQQESSL
jgi:hypothetical protein